MDTARCARAMRADCLHLGGWGVLRFCEYPAKFVVRAGAALSLSSTGAFAQQTSSDEVRATVAQMLNDAESRSSLLAGGDAGHDGRFFIAGDGFRLNIGGLLQFRYVANFRDEGNI